MSVRERQPKECKYYTKNRPDLAIIPSNLLTLERKESEREKTKKKELFKVNDFERRSKAIYWRLFPTFFFFLVNPTGI